VDFFTDTIHAAQLMNHGHPIWGVLTLLLPILGLFMSFIYVGIGRCKRGDSMSLSKFTILSLAILTSLFEALFESMPQLVLQCTAVWRGVVKFEDVFRNPDFWGVFSIISMVCSLSSIMVTASFYNDEKWDGGRSASKFTLNFGVSLTGVLFRLFIGSLLFAVTPYWALGITLLFYTIHLITFKVAGHSWSCLLYSYTCLLFPSGHTKQLGDSPGNDFQHVIANNHSVSEVRRARLNQETLLKQVRISHGLFSILNLVSLVAFIALVETHLFSVHKLPNTVIMEATNRLIIYLIPISLLIMNVALSGAYTHHVKTLRDAVRTWDAITPSVPAHSVSRRSTLQTSSDRSSRVVSPVSPPPPYHQYEQQLPLNPSAPQIPQTVPENTTENSLQRPRPPGNRKCESENCVTCDLMITGTTFKSTMTGKEYKFMPSVGCHTKIIIYLVTCESCKKQYVGKTAQSLKQRHYGHRREIDQQSSSLGQHFAGSCGYTSFRIQIIDHTTSAECLQRREGYWQHELMTLLPWGLNTRDELSGVDVMTLPEAQQEE